MAPNVEASSVEDMRWPVVAAVSFGSLLSAMTASIVNVALPDMARELRTDPATAAWIVLSYLISLTVLLLMAGRVGDMFGHGRAYTGGFGLFGVASLGCALAPSLEPLLVARVIQGVGASLVLACAPALLTSAAPPRRRGFVLGLMSTAVYVGLTIGPPLGGEMVHNLGWRSVYYAMFGAAGVVVLAGLGAIPLRRPVPSQARSFDLGGAALLGVGTLSFLLFSTRVSVWGITHPASIATAAVSAASLPVFLRLQARHPAPLLPPSLFRPRVFRAAVLSAVLNYVALFVSIYLLPFALRDGQGLSPSVIGRVLASQAAGMALFAWGAGWLSDRIGARGLAAVGMLGMTMGLGALALLWPTTGPRVPTVCLFVCGAGTGVFISPNSSALMGSAPRERQGLAGAVMALARTLGMSLGTAVASGMLAVAFPQGPSGGAWPPMADSLVRTGLWFAAAVALLAGIVSAVAHKG